MDPTQQPGDGFYDYSQPAGNRSPTSGRPTQPAAYATQTGFPTGLTMSRTIQRPQQDGLGAAQLLPGLQYGPDESQLGYSTARFDRVPAPQIPGAMGGYMLQNDQSWDYNSATTLGGPLNGTRGPRTMARRAPLPGSWVEPTPQQPMYSFPQINGHPMTPVDAFAPFQSPIGTIGRGIDHRQKPDRSDEIIKTAIVIKNIPFALKKEYLQEIMEKNLGLPMPYAFNYHFEGDAFRGLAFANFVNEEDTATVISRLNGLEVMNRKLRVEYKKQLPDHERERIEREKKEKRGQLRTQHEPIMSMPSTSSLHSVNATVSPSSVDMKAPPTGDLDFNDPLTLNFYTELTLFKNDPNREILIFPSSLAPQLRLTIHTLAQHMGLEHQSAGEADQRHVQVMKRRPVHMQPALTLPMDVSRRSLNRAATIDFAESRVISSNHYHAMGGRQGHPTLEVPGSPEGSGIPSNLRAAKSFADLRSYTPSPSSQSSYPQQQGQQQAPPPLPLQQPNGMQQAPVARYGEYTSKLGGSSLTTPPNLTPTTPGAGISSNNGNGPESLMGGMANLGLGGYESSTSLGQQQQQQQQQQARSTPGAIGSQRPSAQAQAQAQSHVQPQAQAGAIGGRIPAERQPRGPGDGWDSPSAFGARGRTNGHMQRGSADSTGSGSGTNNGAPTARFMS